MLTLNIKSKGKLPNSPKSEKNLPNVRFVYNWHVEDKSTDNSTNFQFAFLERTVPGNVFFMDTQSTTTSGPG